jgi:3-hydroxyisobutyrate dehydrogenase-like beta-hydroxyacid dehydrogenase
MGDDMTDAVGFIGLGNIGAPMASRLLEWPGGLVVFDVRAEACEPYMERGATAAASPAEVAAACGVICVMVQNEDQVRDVLSGDDGILSTARPGTVVAVHSTISAEGAVALAELAAGAGVDLIDAPVSGGAMGAHGGSLAFMIGGPEEAVEKCRGPFGLMAGLISHFGPVWAGTNAKIARNLITFASYAVVGEASRLAEAAGLDLVRLGEVVRHSDQITGGPGAIMLRPTAAPMAADDGLRPIFGHTATLGGKDLHLAVDMAAALGVDAPFAALAEQRLPDALGLGDPDGGS